MRFFSTTLVGLALLTTSSAQARPDIQHVFFKGESVFAGLQSELSFDCGGFVLTAPAEMSIIAFDQVSRTNGNRDAVDQLQVSVFGVNPCVNEYYLGAITVDNANYRQANLMLATIRGTFQLANIYGPGGGGTLTLDLMIRGTGRPYTTRNHTHEANGQPRYISHGVFSTRDAVVSGTANFQGYAFVAKPTGNFLQYTRNGSLTINGGVGD